MVFVDVSRLLLDNKGELTASDSSESVVIKSAVVIATSWSEILDPNDVLAILSLVAG